MKSELFEISVANQSASEATQLASEGEHAELVAALGLTGQSNYTPSMDRPTGSFGYPRVSKRQWRIISTLCPAVTRVEKYASEIIPLEVLRSLARAKSAECPLQFEYFEVHHPEDAVVKDPFLIGIVKQDAYPGATWKTEVRYLIARWGAELDSWESMNQKAGELAKEMRIAALQKIKSEVEAAMHGVDLWWHTCEQVQVPTVRGI